MSEVLKRYFFLDLMWFLLLFFALRDVLIWRGVLRLLSGVIACPLFLLLASGLKRSCKFLFLLTLIAFARAPFSILDGSECFGSLLDSLS